jgi:hypothetical protein
MRYFDLLLAGGKVATATGTDGVSAATGYVSNNPGVTVVAWKAHPLPHGVSVLGRGVIVD